MRDYFVGIAMKGKSMRYLILFSILLSGCLFNSDKSSSQILGYGLGYAGSSIALSQEFWIGIPDSETLSDGRYYFNQSGMFKIIISDSINTLYWKSSSYQKALVQISSPIYKDRAILISTPNGKCLTWPQTGKDTLIQQGITTIVETPIVPCLPFTRE